MAEIVVAIPTYRRPRSLMRLLKALEGLQTDAAVAVIVADNDADRQQGYEVCLELSAKGYRWPLAPVLALERGIAQARNVLVAHALKDPDVRHIAMIDDDEWPSPQWLGELMRVRDETGADAVGGTILFEPAPRRWAAGFDGVASIRRPTGPVEMLEGAGNILIARRCLERMGGAWFDPAFALSGGEDRDFFERIKESGGTFAWSDEGVAYTLVPPGRASLRWTLKRAYGIGNADMRVFLKHHHRPGARLWAGAKVAAALLLSPLLFVMLAAVPNRAADVLRRLWRNAGKLSALFGRHYNGYAVTHGE
jgi:succinoglycan biosynthesis protein ExoM